VRLAAPGLLVLLGHRDRRDQLVRMDSRVHQDSLARRASSDSRVRRDRWASLEQQDPLVPQDRLDSQVKSATPVRPVPRVTVVSRELLVPLVTAE
jgi:hypothetical protein